MGSHHLYASSGLASTKVSSWSAEAKMRPILKKASQSAKSSLDLDRSPVEKSQDGSWGEPDGSRSLSARDVSFSSYRGGATAGGESGPAATSTRVFFHHPGHGRSASQTSTASGSRLGQFVHPFQQTPRTATSPVPYANSMYSADNNATSRDYSPTITEFDDDVEGRLPREAHDSYAQLVGTHYYHTAPFQPAAGRPSFASQRTGSGSVSDLSSPPPLQLRVNTSVASSKTSFRLAHASLASRPSQPDLHYPAASGGGNVESPTGSVFSNNTAALLAGQPLASPISTHSAGTAAQPVASSSDQTMPLRSSFEATVLPARLRSRSDMDTERRQRKIREARRKFQEKERKEQEADDRRRIREREEREAKEARRIEAAARKSSFSAAAAAASRGASLESTRPSLVSRKSTSNSLSWTHQQAAPSGAVSASGSAFSVLSPASGKTKSTGTGPSSSSRSTALDSPANGSWRSWGGGRADEVGSTSGRRSVSRRHTGDRVPMVGNREKQINFLSRDYDTVPENQALPAFGTAAAGEVRFEHQTRPNKPKTAKRKTQGYWHGFILWLRTKLMRLGGR